MTDRNVREIERSLVQRLDRLEKRQRAMGLRAWPGAVRTAVDNSVVVPSAFDVWFESINMVVPSGRWIVFAECDLRPQTNTFPARYYLLGRVEATDADGNVLSLDCDCPTRSWVATIDVSVEFPFTVSADVRFDGGDIKISFLTRENTGLDYDLTYPRLKAIPV